MAPSTGLVREAQSALDLAERSYGATDGPTADMAVNLGHGLNDAEQYDVAVSVLQSALSIYDETSDDPSSGRSLLLRCRYWAASYGVSSGQRKLDGQT